jgi:hypothetical protein
MKIRGLTQSSLVHFFGCESKHRQQFDYDFYDRLGHCGSRLDLRINFKPACEVFDAFEDVDKGIVALPHVLGRLVERLLRTN